MGRCIQLEDLRCVGCGRLTNPTLPSDDPRATREQASGAYVLCTRCELQARAELGARLHERVPVELAGRCPVGGRPALGAHCRRLSISFEDHR